MLLFAQTLDSSTTLISQTGIAGAAVIVMLVMLRQFAATQKDMRQSDQQRLTEFMENMKIVANQNTQTADTLRSTTNVLLDLVHQSREMLAEVREMKLILGHRVRAAP